MRSNGQSTEELLASRQSVYGDRVDNMVRVAQIWTGILGFEVQPVQVALMMAGYKLYRASLTPDYSDNVDDVDGYIQMAREVVGDDMIHARTVDEYLEKKSGRNVTVMASTSVMQEEGRLIEQFLGQRAP